MAEMAALNAPIAVRRAEHTDTKAILKLIEDVGEAQLKSLFGTIDIGHIIEHTELSVVALTNEDDPSTIVGFAAFSSHAPQLTTEAWLDVMDIREYSVSVYSLEIISVRDDFYPLLECII